jgi:hypothetical protein
MRRMAGTLSLTGLILAASSPVHAQKQLTLLATVADTGSPDTRVIEPKDVRVTENGQPATVIKVEPVQRVPKLQVLIDNGQGMPADSIGDLRKGVLSFLAALPPALEVTLVTTAPQPRMLERATTDHEKLVQAVNRLTPDSGGGKFVESLAEAVDRVEKDKQPDVSYTIFSLATNFGDNNARDSDVKKIMERVQARRTTVHVALLNKMTGSGQIQLDLGQAAAGATGGRFEQFNVPNRMLSLLPDIGAQIAKASGPGAKQYRVIIDRPAGVSGDPGAVSLGIAGKTLTAVTMDAAPARR